MHTEYFGPVNREELQGLECPSRKLQQGGLVAFPTETVYGIGATILNIEAIKRLYQVKNRDATHSLPIHVSNMDQLKFVASDIPPEAEILSKHFFPGPLTLILKKNANLSDVVTGGKPTVAIRISSDPIPRRLVELTGCPLAVPSANITGKPSSTQARHVLEDFNGKIEGVVDGGAVEYGMESTIVSLEDPLRPTILRFGIISQRAIENVLNRKVIVHPLALTLNGNSELKELCPAIRLFSSWEEMNIYLKLSSKSKRMIMSSETSQIQGEHFHLDGKNLYEGLRLADREGYAEVLVLCSAEIKKNTLLLSKLKQIART